MTPGQNKAQAKAKSDALASLLERNRTKVVWTGATIDELIRRHLKKGRFFAALGDAVAELERSGADYENYARVAGCEMIVGLNTRAKRSWKEALRFKETAQAYTGIGTVFFRQGEIAEAIKAFQKAISLDATNLEALESLSAAYLYLDKPVDARGYADTVLRLDDERLESRLCRARAEIALGNYARAKADIAFVSARRYKENEVRLLEVDLLIHGEEFESAMFLAAQLCERYPVSHDCLDAFRRSYAAFDESDRRADLLDFLDGLDHFTPLPKARERKESDAIEIVDVIIPVHNAWRAVEECVASVKASSGVRLGRVILVNDASDDETLQGLLALSDADDQIVLVETEQQSGFSCALALGVAQSTATAFVALNSDTIVTHGWLDKLHAALRSAPEVAMVGPLSNNAGWQNYGAVLGQSGGFAGSRTPSASCRADIDAEISGGKRRSFVPLHILHGFCVLMDRKVYDAHGGVDQEVFPEGYGEFQDLSIRMRAARHELLAVADCVVFHERGTSLSPAHRAALSLGGRKSLYARYSALNYLCLEMASARNPILESYRETLRAVLESWGIRADG